MIIVFCRDAACSVCLPDDIAKIQNIFRICKCFRIKFYHIIIFISFKSDIKNVSGFSMIPHKTNAYFKLTNRPTDQAILSPVLCHPRAIAPTKSLKPLHPVILSESEGSVYTHLRPPISNISSLSFEHTLASSKTSNSLKNATPIGQLVSWSVLYTPCVPLCTEFLFIYIINYIYK